MYSITSQNGKKERDNKTKDLDNRGDLSQSEDQKKPNGRVRPPPITDQECRKIFNSEKVACFNACSTDYEIFGKGKMTFEEYEERNHYRTSHKTKQVLFPQVVQGFKSGQLATLPMYKNRVILGISNWTEEEIYVNNLKPSDVASDEICYSIVWTNKPDNKILEK